MITVEHLTKRYGDFTAVDDISFTIGEGHIYGFLGPNGAGKSTTMNIMTGCLAATSGEVKIDGCDIFEQARQAKQNIGYLPEIPPLYTEETPEEYLRFVAQAKGVPARQIPAEIERVMQETRLTEMGGRLIRNLSKGYRQRVGIAQALLGNPKYIILDEPTVGLDPLQIIEIRDLIRQLGQTHTVIFSSHILSEVQAICDKILIIAHGRLIAFDEPAALEKSLLAGSSIAFTTEATAAQVQQLLSGMEEITGLELHETGNGLVSAQCTTDSRDIYAVSRRLFFAFAGSGKALLELRLQKASLEDIFIELTESSDPASQAENTTAEGEEEQNDSRTQA